MYVKPTDLPEIKIEARWLVRIRILHVVLFTMLDKKFEKLKIFVLSQDNTYVVTSNV